MSAAPTRVARWLAIVDYRNKTYFRIKDGSKTGACSAASRWYKERIRLEVAKGTLDSSHVLVCCLRVVPGRREIFFWGVARAKGRR